MDVGKGYGKGGGGYGGGGYGSGTGQYTEVTRSYDAGNSAAGKVGGACCSCFCGIFLYFACLAAIAWNEMHSVCTSRALEAARTTYEEIDCRSTSSGPNGLAYISCDFNPESFQRFTPASFGSAWMEDGFEIEAVRAQQTVKMLQCQEKKETREEKERNSDRKVTITTYKYDLVWSESYIDSGGFKGFQNREAGDEMRIACGQGFRGNPKSMELGTKVLSSGQLKMGDFDLSKKIGDVPLNSQVMLKEKAYSPPGGEKRYAADGIAYTRNEFQDYYGSSANEMWNKASKVTIRGGGHSLRTCGQDQVGCLDISFSKTTAKHGSYLGRIQSNKKIRPWGAPSSWMCSSGLEVELFQADQKDASELVNDAQTANTTQLWVIRLVCIVLTIVGVQMFLQPIQAAADFLQYLLSITSFIPLVGSVFNFVGDAISGAVGCAIFMISIGIGLPSSLLVLSFFYALMRPLIAIPIFLGSLAMLYFTYQKMAAMAAETKKSKKQ